jgi:PAS domain S-box-containing protein
MNAIAGVNPGSWTAQRAAVLTARPLIWFAALSLGYYATAVVGYGWLMIRTEPAMAVLWAPNVLLFVSFLVAPYRSWPAIIGLALLTQFAVAATVPIPLGRSLAMFVGNVSQSALAASALRWLGHRGEILETLRGATAFVAVAVLGAPAIASLLSAAALSAGGWITAPWPHWRMRLVTNVLSTIVLAPPLLTLLRWRSLPRSMTPQLAEFLILVTGLTACERLVSTLVTPMTVTPLLFAPLPFLLWAAVRFGQAGLGLVLCFAMLFRYFANSHLAPFTASITDAIVVSQLTLIAMSLPLIFLSALLTERRAIEQELRTRHTLYELATTAGAVGVWDWNLETNFIYVDPALKKLLGVEDGVIADRPDDWVRRIHPDDGPRLLQAARDHIYGRTPAFELTHRLLHRDGSVRWFLARGSVVERKGGTAIRMIGTATDITAQKASEQALEEAQSELRRLTRLSDMGGLTATIAHEVNQPLCAIVTNASAALRWLGHPAPDVVQMRGALEDVVHDGKRASELIRRTRGLFERGEIERNPVNLNDVIHSALSLTRKAVDARRVAVRIDLDPALPLVRADQLQLQQVFCNLVVNAVEAMTGVDDRQPALTILTRSHESGGVYARVSDTGEGFDGEDPERVFRPLVSTRPEGMGIGLSMSRIIVEMHGGRLWATPNETIGATFHMLLPLTEQHG